MYAAAAYPADLALRVGAGPVDRGMSGAGLLPAGEPAGLVGRHAHQGMFAAEAIVQSVDAHGDKIFLVDFDGRSAS